MMKDVCNCVYFIFKEEEEEIFFSDDLLKLIN